VATFKVAAVQAAPVLLDRDATLDRVEALVAEAGRHGARLAVFPETFVPGYPVWTWGQRVWNRASRQWHGLLIEQSVVAPGPATDRIGKAARAAKCYVAIGVNERDAHGSTVYNTLLYFDDRGELLGKHRKLMPTGGERLVWGAGDGSTLPVFDTPFGRLGGLICWENYMPLARTAMYAQGVEVWVAPTWDQQEPWVSSLRHIAREGRMYVVGVGTSLSAADIPPGFPERQTLLKVEEEWFNEGWTTICGPEGEILAGPLVKEQGILYADVDLSLVRGSRLEFDAVGHYSRPDVFRLSVNTGEAAGVTFDPAPIAHGNGAAKPRGRPAKTAG
jgi:nitrilase